MKTFTQSTRILVAAAAMIVGAGASYADTYAPSTLQSGTNASLLSLVSGYTSNNGAVTITYLGDNLPPELVIPSRINGEPVVCIGDGDRSVTYCGAPEDADYPFETSIVIPDSVKKINDHAFFACFGLTSIVIPDGVEHIGDYAFAHCTGLTSIVIPDSVKYIGKNAFAGCMSLTSIKFPAGLKRINDNTFSSCQSLEAITIPDSVTSVGDGAFSNCASLQVIYAPYGANYGSNGSSFNKLSDGNNAEVSELEISCNTNSGTVTIEYIYESGIPRTMAMNLPPREPLVIPSRIAGCPVTQIGYDGCGTVYDAVYYYDNDGQYSGEGYYYYGATSIVIPEGVKSIGMHAFAQCYGLTSIVIPGSVEYIGLGAFEACESLTAINLPEGLKVICQDAFRGCQSLESITIPNSVTRMERQAFSGCHGIESMTIPDSVTYVGENVFSNCAFLEVIYAPYGANYGSNLSDGNNAIVSQLQIDCITNNGTATIKRIREGDIPLDMAMYLPPRENLVIPRMINGNLVTGIGSGDRVYDAVYFEDYGHEEYEEYYYGAPTITLPDTVRRIEDNAFGGCYGLTSVVIPESVEYIGRGAFEDCESLTSIELPEGLKRIYGRTFFGCQSLESITIPNSVTRIDGNAFSGCHSLEAVTIPDGVTSVGNSVFSNCSALRVIYVPYGASYGNLSSGNNAIVSALQISCVTNNGAVTISRIWEECLMTTYLPPRENLVIPRMINGSLVTGIGNYNGSVYEAIYIEDNVGYYCGATTITLPDSVRTICDYAFQYCFGLKSIVIPDKVEYIGDYAFQACGELTSIVIPDSVKYIGCNAFEGCSSLTSVKLPAGLKRIYVNTFSGCQSLESITIPNTVMRIDDNAFSCCHGLESVIIPDRVMYVGNNVFYHSSGLEKIYVFNRPEYNLARLYEGNDAQAAYATATSPTTAKGVSYAMIDTAIEKNAAFKAVALAHDGSYDSLVKKTAENGKNTIEECLIIGIDPTNEEAKFTTSIEIVDGEPKITYTPDLGQERKYVTMGCAELGGAWKVVDSDAAKEGLRFFKVTVAMP